MGQEKWQNLERETAWEGAATEFPLSWLLAVAAEARQVALQLALDHSLETGIALKAVWKYHNNNGRRVIFNMQCLPLNNHIVLS